MNKFRFWASTLSLAALMSAGCFLISGQFTVSYEFDTPINVTSPTAVFGQLVDLSTESEYNDNKDKIETVSDLALLGQFTNTGAATSVEVWMVASPGAALTTDAAVRAAGQRLWGPVALGSSETASVGWDQSAQLFVGRQALIDEIKGDGEFALYALGTTGTYSFRIENGALIAVISAGK